MREAMERLDRLEDIMCEMIQTALPPSENCAPMPISQNPPDGNAEARALAALAAVLACSAKDTGSPPAGETAAHPSPQPTLGYISRRRLLELAVGLGEAPLHTQPQFNRGLRLVGDLASGSAQPPAPIYVHLDQHLRLPLDNSSNSLEIQRRLGGNWHPTGLRAIKDGMGGIEVDIARLERLAGPLSSELRRALTLDSRPLRSQHRPQHLQPL
ncbi:hypothetical protein JWJ88_00335 [Paracoccus methylovorus]|uniref:Uncharacterized protein n=1 Tax=Paracoccus methylovorus TaxID=2812658 RepID=A0ABX7JGK1_9RHOB|nr:hypothetical protein [Paracoccus methylovorus]QRZ13145.1 hypothetical protein JWJ88_00335 [Paracoccus methylovorus]